MWKYLCAAATLIATPALAGPLFELGTGVPISPDVFTSVPGTVVADTGLQTVTASSFTAEIREIVIRDSFFGDINGDLTFAFQVDNLATSAAAITTITLDDFKGWPIDGGHAPEAGPLAGGGINLTDFTRSGFADNGDIITADFGNGGLLPGETSNPIILHVQASAFAPTPFFPLPTGPSGIPSDALPTISIGTTSINAFAPAYDVPIPATLPLFGTAVGALMLWRRRRCSKA
jgi:hypothetical protein